jgi:hypothetical protein
MLPGWPCREMGAAMTITLLVAVLVKSRFHVGKLNKGVEEHRADFCARGCAMNRRLVKCRASGLRARRTAGHLLSTSLDEQTSPETAVRVSLTDVDEVEDVQHTIALRARALGRVRKVCETDRTTTMLHEALPECVFDIAEAARGIEVHHGADTLRTGRCALTRIVRYPGQTLRRGRPGQVEVVPSFDSLPLANHMQILPLRRPHIAHMFELIVDGFFQGPLGKSPCSPMTLAGKMQMLSLNRPRWARMVEHEVDEIFDVVSEGAPQQKSGAS